MSDEARVTPKVQTGHQVVNSLQLVFFSKEGASSEVQDLIQYGEKGKGGCSSAVSPNSVDQRGRSALFQAARHGHNEVVQLLCEAGANTEAADPISGSTALQIAVQSGHPSVVGELLKRGAAGCSADERKAEAMAACFREEYLPRGHPIDDPLPESEHEEPAIVEAAFNDDVDAVRMLMAAGASLDVTDCLGQTALWNAAGEGYLELVRILIAAGADVHKPNEDNLTALHVASKEGFVEVVSTLAASGAQVNARTDDGNAPLHLASGWDGPAHTEVIGLLVEHGADTEQSNGDHVRPTPLLIASYKGDLQVVQSLLAHGANTETRNGEGETALLLTCRCGHELVASELIRHKADVEARSNDENTPLASAAIWEHPAVIKVLLEAGANKHARILGETALEIGRACDDVVRLLDDNIVLLDAAAAGDADAVRRLLAETASLSFQDPEGWCACTLAIHNGHLALARELAAKHAKQSAPGRSEDEVLQSMEEDAAALADTALEVFRGNAAASPIDRRARVVSFASFNTIRDGRCCPPLSKVYYELKVARLMDDPQFGFAMAGFQRCQLSTQDGVGDDAASWAVDGVRSITWHDNRTSGYHAPAWQVGDVIGLACDLARQQLLVSVNGDWSAPNGVVFSLSHLPADARVFAAFTAGSGAVEYNMGDRVAFRFEPPGDDFVAVAHAVERGEEAQLPGQARHHTGSDSSMAAAPDRDDATPSSEDAREADDRPTCDELKLLRKLGEGGQGSVWLGLDSAGVKVAVKVRKCAHSEQHRRVQIEAHNLQAVTELKLHSNVVRYIDCRVTPRMSVLVMEFVEGVSLRSRITPEAGMAWTEVQWILTGVLRGLDQLHGLQLPISHRDVKPDNIMLAGNTADRRTRRAVLVDFGMSKRARCDQTTTLGEFFVGSPAYFSPEQARGSPDLDVRVDVWAAGVVLYEMLVGYRPFGRDDADVLRLLEEIKNSAVAPIADLALRVPKPTQAAALRLFLDAALAKAREERFAHAGAMLAVWDTLCATPREVPAALRDRDCTAPAPAPAAPSSTRGAAAASAPSAGVGGAEEEDGMRESQDEAEKRSGSGSGQKPRILAFFAQERGDAINVWGESQELENLMSRFGSFEVSMNVQPMFADFHQAVRLAAARNCRVVHMSGHGEHTHGFYFASDRSGLGSHPIDPGVVAHVIGSKCRAHGGPVECVLLNACNTEEMAQRLRAEGVSHVACWRLRVDDEAARVFARVFYCELDILAKTARRDADGCPDSHSDQRYKKAFQAAAVELQVWNATSSGAHSSRERKSCSHEPGNLAVFLSERGNLEGVGKRVG